MPAALLAAGLIVVAAFVRRIGDFGVESDLYGTYAPGALRILNGDFDLTRYGVTGPFYEILLALGMALGISAFSFGKAVAVASTLGTLAVWTALARRVVGSRAGSLVPWLLLLSPAFVRFGYIASSDAFYAFLVSVVVYLLVRNGASGRSIWAGIVALVACLTRYQALVLPAFAFIWLAGKPGGLRRWGAFIAVFPLGLVLVGVLLTRFGVELPQPDFLYNIEYESSQTRVDWDHYNEVSGDRGSPVAVVRRVSGRLLTTALTNVPEHLLVEARDGAGMLLTALVVIAAAAPRRFGSGRIALLRLFGLWLVSFVSLLSVQASERYALPEIPVLAVVAAWGLDTWHELVPARLTRRLAILLGLVFLLGIAWNAREQVAYQSRQPTSLLALAKEVRGEIPPGSTLMARKPHLAYLLGAEWAYFPDVPDLKTLRERMRPNPPRYVFYGASELALRPAFRFLSFPPYRPPGWTVVHADPGKAVLYRLEPEFLSTEIPGDDAILRGLENAALRGGIPIEPARRLARYMTETGRYRGALAEYERLQQFTPLSEEERRLMQKCRRSLGG